jgi:thiosulfate/3-mercaptopyruvate sulfurtransferase
MTSNNTDPFVTCEWLAEKIANKEKKMSIFDCSWYPPSDKRDCKAEFLSGHIPGAQFFDIDEIADKQTDLPHMLPPVKQFEEQISALGVSNDHHVVLYDTSGYYFASARVWWTFRVFGHDNVSVLAGGFMKWKQFGLPIETGPARPPVKGNFKVHKFRKELVMNLDDIKEYLEKRHFHLVDARSKERFEGKGPERPKVKFGHIPGAKNVPIMHVVEPGTGHLRSEDELAKLFQSAGVDLTKPIVCSCASGVSASVVALALYKLGRKDVPVYDGSWTEYGSERYDHPIETAPNVAK